jgi:hypothetical protein
MYSAHGGEQQRVCQTPPPSSSSRMRASRGIKSDGWLAETELLCRRLAEAAGTDTRTSLEAAARRLRSSIFTYTVTACATVSSSMYGDPGMSRMGTITATQHSIQTNPPSIDHAHMCISCIVALVRPLESPGGAAAGAALAAARPRARAPPPPPPAAAAARRARARGGGRPPAPAHHSLTGPCYEGVPTATCMARSAH